MCLPGKAGKEMTLNHVCETFFAFCKWLFLKYFPFTVCICPGSGACTTVLCLLVLSCSLSPIGPSDSLSPYFCRNTNITVEKGQNNRYITVAKYIFWRLSWLWIRGYEVNCRRSRNVDNQLITRKKLNNAHTISILKADISV